MITLQGISILIVDDIKSMRRVLGNMLQRMGIGKKLYFAKDGREGFKLLNEVKPDIAIIDWKMPVMNGTELLEKIRSSKDFRDMPVIMITGAAEKDIVAEVAETAIDAYLIKPLTPKLLEKKIKTIIEYINDPHPATPHVLKAREYEEAGDIQMAIKEMVSALKHKPNASRILRRLGSLYLKTNAEKSALKCLKKAASVNPDDAMSQAIMGDICLQKNQYEEAAQYYQQMMAISAKYVEKVVEFGETLMEKGRSNLAVELFDKAWKREAKQNFIKERIIEICMKNREMNYVKKLIKLYLKENPADYEMIYKAGVIFNATGDAKTAFTYFMKADKKLEGHIDVKIQLANIYFQKGKPILADSYLNQVLRLDPENIAALSLKRQM